MKNKRPFGLLLLLLGMLPVPALADSGDTAWILTSSALVLLMTLPALALFYSGLVRNKNVISVFFHCVLLAAMLSVLWAVIGYSLAFSGGGKVIGDLGRFMLHRIEAGDDVGTLPESVFALFQMTFAVITPALVVGAYVERITLRSMMIISGLWLLIVYAPVCHWIWGGGFLGDLGVLDFAGGLVVHATAGTAAVVLAIKLGKRERFPVVGAPVSPLLCGVGGCLLWVGWFGFNGGSALAANGDAGNAILATHLAASAGMLVWLLLDYARFQKTGVITAATGLIAGLATVTPAAGFISPGGGLLLGVFGGLVCYFAVLMVRMRWELDDSLDVFAVHGIGGMAGTILLPIVAWIGGREVEAGVMSQVGVQVVGTVAVVAWTVVATWVIATAVDKVFPLRVSPEVEDEGLDSIYHDEHGFNINS